MFRLALTMGTVLGLLCCGNDDANQQPNKKEKAGPFPCTCLVWGWDENEDGDDDPDTGNWTYYAELHSGPDCFSPDFALHEDINNIASQDCETDGSCQAGARLKSKKLECITPTDDYKIDVSSSPLKILTTKVIQFRPKKNESLIKAKVHLLETKGVPPKSYRLIGIGRELDGNSEQVQAIIDDQGKKKLVKKAGRCAYDVLVGTTTFRIHVGTDIRE